MDLIIASVVIVIGPFVALALAALRFGADSRLTIGDSAGRWI